MRYSMQVSVCCCVLAGWGGLAPRAAMAHVRAHAAIQVAATPVDGDAIRTALFENTMRFPTVNGKSATAYLGEDGKLRGTYAGKRFEGQWEIRDNQLCLDFPTNPINGCWSVFRNRDGTLQLFSRFGMPAGFIDVAKGNPDKF
jgi:hypothetical protein